MTLEELMQAVGALEIPGVKTRCGYGEVPTSFAGAKLPLSFVELPDVEHGVPVLFRGGYWPTYRVDLLVVVAPMGRGRLSDVQVQIVKMMDAVVSVLRTADLGGHTFAVRPDVLERESAAYWIVRAEIEVGGE